MDWVTVLASSLGALAGGTAGAYFKEYFGGKGKTRAEYEDSQTLLATEHANAYEQEKGKRLATHEDVENVLMEVKAITREAEKIKAQVGGDLWIWQAVWSLKQKFLYDLLASTDSLKMKFAKFEEYLASGMGAYTAEEEAKDGLARLSELCGLARVLLDDASVDLLEPTMQKLSGLVDFSNPEIGKLARGVLNDWRLTVMRVARRELRKGGRGES